MLKKQLLVIGILLICMSILSACVDFNIINQSEVGVRVRIQTPDGGNYVKRVEPLASGSSFSNHGGIFTITTLQDENYINLLENLRNEISRRLFEESNTLSPEDVQKLVNNLNDIDKQLELSAQGGTSCSGSAPDFSTVTATLSWSQVESSWHIACAVSDTDE